MAGKSHYSIRSFHPPLGRDDGVPLVLAAEVRLLARLVHPNLVRPVTIGESSEGHHLVMEYVEGTRLDEVRREAWRRGREIPLRVTLRVVLDALAGLVAIHEATDQGGRPLGLVHRGLSPACVLIGVDGVARVADLGVERRMGYVDAMRKQHIDRRAELFAVGIMLWEGAANRRLFEPEGDGDGPARIARHTIPRLDAVSGAVPRGVASVCARALDPDVGWRYPSAAALAEALEGAALDAEALGDHAEVARFTADLMGEPAAPPEPGAPPEPAGGRRRAFAAGTDDGSYVLVTEQVDDEMVEIRPPRPWYRGWLVALGLAVAVVAATVAAVGSRREAAADLLARSRAAAGRIGERLAPRVARVAEVAGDGGAETALVVAAGKERAALAGELPQGLFAASLRVGEKEVELLAPPGARSRRAARDAIPVPLPPERRLPPLTLSIARPLFDTGRLLLARWIAIGFALACLVLYLDGHRRHRWWRRRG